MHDSGPIMDAAHAAPAPPAARRALMRRALALAAAAWVLATAAAPLSPCATGIQGRADERTSGSERAPDGSPGLGGRERLRDLLKLLRTPDDEEQALLAGIDGLASAMNVLESTAVGLYRGRGYFDLLGPTAEPDHGALARAFRDALGDPSAVLRGGDARAVAFAGMLFDERFRARLEILDGWRAVAQDLQRGMDLLRGAARSYMTLTEHEGRALARLVDLAAADLRLRKLDLEALAEAPSAPWSVADFELQSLIEAARAGDEETLGRAISGALLEELGVEGMLFSVRALGQLGPERTWRVDEIAAAGAHLREAELALPESKPPGGLPRELERMSKTERRKLARAHAIEGLARDPLDEELTWIAAVTGRIVRGRLEAFSMYDRFLHLRGIVHNDERTLRGRQLTEREEEALLFIQEYESTFTGLAGDPAVPGGLGGTGGGGGTAGTGGATGGGGTGGGGGTR